MLLAVMHALPASRVLIGAHGSCSAELLYRMGTEKRSRFSSRAPLPAERLAATTTSICSRYTATALPLNCSIAVANSDRAPMQLRPEVRQPRSGQTSALHTPAASSRRPSGDDGAFQARVDTSRSRASRRQDACMVAHFRPRLTMSEMQRSGQLPEHCTYMRLCSTRRCSTLRPAAAATAGGSVPHVLQLLDRCGGGV